MWSFGSRSSGGGAALRAWADFSVFEYLILESHPHFLLDCSLQWSSLQWSSKNGLRSLVWVASREDRSKDLKIFDVSQSDGILHHAIWTQNSSSNFLLLAPVSLWTPHLRCKILGRQRQLCKPWWIANLKGKWTGQTGQPNGMNIGGTPFFGLLPTCTEIGAAVISAWCILELYYTQGILGVKTLNGLEPQQIDSCYPSWPTGCISTNPLGALYLQPWSTGSWRRNLKNMNRTFDHWPRIVAAHVAYCGAFEGPMKLDEIGGGAFSPPKRVEIGLRAEVGAQGRRSASILVFTYCLGCCQHRHAMFSVAAKLHDRNRMTFWWTTEIREIRRWSEPRISNGPMIQVILMDQGFNFPILCKMKCLRFGTRTGLW